MRLPEYGLCLPCVYRCCRSADTIEVSPPASNRRWVVRLLDYEAPNLAEPRGPEALRFAQELLEQFDGVLSLFLPISSDATATFKDLRAGSRVSGHLFLGTEETLSDILIRAGHGIATQERPR